MKIIFLGSGTSGGIPEIACSCRVCSSTDIHDKRTRSSLFISTDKVNILIDSSTDLRQQLLREQICRVDAVFYTHAHADHCLGLDDLRSVSRAMGSPIDIYADKEQMRRLSHTFEYIFEGPPQKGGGVVQINPNIIDYKDMMIGDVKIRPVKVKHGVLYITGYIFNDKLVYITDASLIPEETYDLIKAPEILVLNTLRYTKHSTHFNVEESIAAAKRIDPGNAYFVHMCHKISHAETSKELPANVFLAYDGLSLEI